MKVSKDTSNHHLAESQSPPVPGLDYSAEWIAELENLSAAIGKSAAELLYMRWNSRQMSVDFEDRSKLAMFVRKIPVDANDVLTEHQLGLLYPAITEWLFCNGNNNRKSYYRYLLESKEKLTENQQEVIRKLARERNRPDVLEMNSLQKLVWFYNERMECGIHWQGLVGEGTRIKVFVTETAHLLNPGNAIGQINQKIITYNRKTAPPISLEDELKNKGYVLVADLEIYVVSDKGNIKPYFCRYWFDTENSVWRLKCVVFYPKQKDLDITHIVS
jgi:hypothetical protein